MAETSTMEQNLRNLMAAAAEKRLALTINKVEEPASDSISKNEAQPGTSALPSEKLGTSDPEDDHLSTSTEFFESSAELFPDSPFVEQCSSQENDQLTEWKCYRESKQRDDSICFFAKGYEEKGHPEVELQFEEKVLLRSLNRIPDCSARFRNLVPSRNHSIMFSPHMGDVPPPYPSTYEDKWDCNHVRMPCSPQNKFPVEDLHGEKQIQSRWDLICQSLRRKISTSQEFEEAIMTYNSQYKGKWEFSGLHQYFQNCTTADRGSFFGYLYPKMVDMALDLPNICTQPIPLLKKGEDHYLTLSKKQIGCLLLNAFFCTFPRRNTCRNSKSKWHNEYSSYPDINFNRLFQRGKRFSPAKFSKYRCLINYFKRIVCKEPTGSVTFHRQFLEDLPRWNYSTKEIRKAVIKSEGVIETDGHGLLQVDFANKFVGGGVLGSGCVQEEIRFLICPELIVSRLFVESLGPTEALIVTGVEQYNTYTGYGNTFKWKDNFVDKSPKDPWGRTCTEVVAIDATHFHSQTDQYQSYMVQRELHKAFCGFYEDAPPANLSAIATGNWGCGVFKGDPHFKFLIQLAAASEADRDLLYFTYENLPLKMSLKEMYDLMAGKNLVVGDLSKILISYCQRVKVMPKKKVQPNFYDFLFSLFSNDTDDEGNKMTPQAVIAECFKNSFHYLT